MLTDPELLEVLRPRAAEAADYAVTHGLVKYRAPGALGHAPFALVPAPIDSNTLATLEALTAPYNALAHHVARDPAFIREALEDAAAVDPFTALLLERLPAGAPTQPLHLQLTRSDYFLHVPSAAASAARPAVRQVELNLISASYAGLSGPVNRLHRYLLHGTPWAERLCPNDPLPAMADGIVGAWEAYGHDTACVLMVVQPDETNVFDQRLLEFALRERGIRTQRMTLAEIGREARLRDGHLWAREALAAVTYFRAGYGPEDYDTPDAVRGRELVEASSTVAVPSVATQLVGTKKMQQVLADPTVLARFAPPGDAARLEAASAGLWALEQPIATRTGETPAWRAALASPDDYVLKPQREGGGHNHFGREMVAVLEGLQPAQRAAYVLMERLRPAAHETLLVREGAAVPASAVSEIGRFGVYLADGERVLRNEDTGYLVRTKGQDVTEGGISAGFGFLDSLLLTEPGP